MKIGFPVTGFQSPDNQNVWPDDLMIIHLACQILASGQWQQWPDNRTAYTSPAVAQSWHETSTMESLPHCNNKHQTDTNNPTNKIGG